MAERFNAPDLKSDVLAMVPGVRIPVSPQKSNYLYFFLRQFSSLTYIYNKKIMNKRGGHKVAYENGLLKYVKSIRLSNEEVFVENSTYARHHIKKRVIEESLIPYECFSCGNKGVWMEKPLPLILDHINGVNNDNRIENLRFACSNCDSQLHTYKNRRGKSNM